MKVKCISLISVRSGITHSLPSVLADTVPTPCAGGRQAAQACVKYSEASWLLTFLCGLWRPVASRFVCESTDQLQFFSQLGHLRI